MYGAVPEYAVYGGEAALEQSVGFVLFERAVGEAFAADSFSDRSCVGRRETDRKSVV